MLTRPLTTMEEYEAAYRLQVVTWGKEQSVPTNQMVVATKIGGLVLGAFDDQGDLAGLSFGLPALDGGEPYLWSDILVTRPDMRGRGVGAQLKWAQREAALSKGYRVIRWTYDPLQSVNARLNIGRLGASANLYLENVYGCMQDSLNQGLPTDRLVVSWDLLSPRVVALAQGGPPQPESATGPSILAVEGARPVAIVSNLTGPVLRCPIPESIDQLRQEQPALAQQWRLLVRQALTQYFSLGYTIDGVEEAGPGLVAYLLRTHPGRDHAHAD